MISKQLFDEDDLIPISALQHLIFCERQCALIHLERIWDENKLTIEGNYLHEKVDIPKSTNRGKNKIVRSLRLRSLKYGLTGIADVVEFHKSESNSTWIPYPIEYKRGKPKKDLSDVIQLCAQALCLEEMLNISVLEGAMFYGETNRRLDVIFDKNLRDNAVELIKKLHVLFQEKKTPPAIFEKKCQNCSLINWCMPVVTGCARSAIKHNEQMFECIQ